MRRVSTVLGVALVLAMVASAAYAQRQDHSKVTGGGQIDFPADNAGNTLTFQGHQGSPRGDWGIVTYVGTKDAGNGTQPEFWMGSADCVDIVNNRARLSGSTTKGTDFWLEVVDTGVPADGADLIRINDDSDKECDEEDDGARSTELGRGNATVHDAG